MTNPNPRATHELLLRQLALYLREAEEILAAWDAYSDEHTGPDGWPHDEQTYGLRQSQRDGDTWRSFNRIRTGAKALVATAEVHLQALPKRSIHPHWAWQISCLNTALGRISALQSEWLDRRSTAPASARPGTGEYDGPLAERNAEAWHHLNEWALHGQAVLDIHTAVQHHRPGLTSIAPAPALPGPAAPPSPARR
ncbi:hypothetical protein ACFQL8_19460 [Streptomyces goshikiensis]|uniref:hypothetical protein n=1 Tax=Streptomyces goshikiensis TaxID=1942 RepID=UPI001672BBB2|nr:hypothetical protein [Streptomyces goshikiensis]GHD79491.1 hypothetical protein GCM10010336_61630 [Streptomyces goshikiensis]